MQGRGAVGLRCNPLLCHHQCPHRYYIGKQRGGAVRHWRLEPDSMRGWLLRRGWLRGGAPGATCSPLTSSPLEARLSLLAQTLLLPSPLSQYLEFRPRPLPLHLLAHL